MRLLILSILLIARPSLNSISEMRLSGFLGFEIISTTLLIGAAYFFSLFKITFTAFLRDAYFWLFVSLISIMFLSMTINQKPNLLSTMSLITRFVSFLSIYLYSRYIFSTKTVKLPFYVIIISSFIPVVFGLHQYLNGTGLANRGVVATYGTFFHPNMFGNFLLVISLVAIYLIFSADKKLEKILLWIYVLVLLFLILNTYGRAVQLTALFCIGIFTLRFSRKLFILFCLLGVAFSLLSTDILQNIIMRFQQTDSTGLPLSGRLLVWKPMIELFKEHPILGIGPNNWVNLHHGFAPHNEFIRFLTETGFLGCAIFTGIWLSLLFKFAKMFFHNKSPLILLAFLVVLSAVFLMSTSNLGTKAELQWTIWAIIGFILGVFDREKIKIGKFVASTMQSIGF